MSSAARSKRVRVVIRPDAHVDEAHLAAGFVAKGVPLSVPDNTARELLAAHTYLAVMED